ncbi:hypothetical protein H0H87_010689 [Tephrocybe sp. NHM501043]|nr:hypothetical protein H0H87_010689 [Tephrocybe sp. NHM501043]
MGLLKLAPTSFFLDAGVVLFCISLSAWCYTHRRHYSGKIEGYILENQVTHTRLLPLEASHAFTYPILSLFASLDALEGHRLDLCKGWVFGYGGRWGRLIGLRANPYFADVGKAKTIRQKLDDVLSERGFKDIEDVHNTFGETHVYVLEVGKNEDSTNTRPKGRRFIHQWTFLREFHVSPFNDRSGFYTISIKSPSHPPTQSLHHNKPPRPAVRIHLHNPSDTQGIGPLKLTALLRSTASFPLTTPNVLASLSRLPFALLLSMPRILRQAWTLHYRKRLNVFLRPEPLPPSQKPEFGAWRRGGGVKWLREGLLERYARGRVLAFLGERADQAGVHITLVSADPLVPDYTMGVAESTQHLVITYLSPRFFTILFTVPSPEHALLLASDTEHIFSVSSRELFITVFTPPTPSNLAITSLQLLRKNHVPSSIPLCVPSPHFLDSGCSSRVDNVKAELALRALFFLEHLQRWIFSMVHARIVLYKEPWTVWRRAEKVFWEHRGIVLASTIEVRERVESEER